MTVSSSEDFWGSVNKLSKNPDRPKRNSKFIIVLSFLAVAGIVVFAILATTTASQRDSCPCTTISKTLMNGDKILDPLVLCQSDEQYKQCYRSRNDKYKLFAGLAGGSAGLLVLALVMFRYG
eukprot:jgi/Chrzof1/12047/Cz06g19120.t1